METANQETIKNNSKMIITILSIALVIVTTVLVFVLVTSDDTPEERVDTVETQGDSDLGPTSEVERNTGVTERIEAEKIESSPEVDTDGFFASSTYSLRLKVLDGFDAYESNGNNDSLFGGVFEDVPRIVVTKPNQTVYIFKYGDALDIYQEQLGGIVGAGGTEEFTFDYQLGDYQASRYDVWGVIGEPSDLVLTHRMTTYFSAVYGDEPSFSTIDPLYKVQIPGTDMFNSYLILYSNDLSVSIPENEGGVYQGGTIKDIVYSEDIQFITVDELVHGIEYYEG